jgi:hypothetical protein
MWYIYKYISQLELKIHASLVIRHNRIRRFLEVLQNPPESFAIQTIVNSPQKLQRIYKIDFSLNTEEDCDFLSVDTRALQRLTLTEQNSGQIFCYDDSTFNTIPSDLLINFCNDKYTALNLLLRPEEGSDWAYELFAEEVEHQQYSISSQAPESFRSRCEETLNKEIIFWFEQIDQRVVERFGITIDDVRALISPHYSDGAFQDYVIYRNEVAKDMGTMLTVNPLARKAPDNLIEELSAITNIPLAVIREGRWPRITKCNLDGFIKYWFTHKQEFVSYYDLYQTGAVVLRQAIEESITAESLPPTDLLISAVEYLIQENIILRHDPEIHQMFWTHFKRDAYGLGVGMSDGPTEMERAVTWNERAYVWKHIFSFFEREAIAGQLKCDDAKRIIALHNQTNRLQISKSTLILISRIASN